MKRLIPSQHMTAALPGLVLALSGAQALAALGQAPSLAMPSSAAVMAPPPKALAVTSATRAVLYTSHPMQLDNGTLVQEYATLAGQVFAVSWRGPVLPDLSQLLGEYFKAYKLETDQARALGKRGSPVTVLGTKLIVRSSGRMRSFAGYAYAPELIPAGVNINDVLQ